MSNRRSGQSLCVASPLRPCPDLQVSSHFLPLFPAGLTRGSTARARSAGLLGRREEGGRCGGGGVPALCSHRHLRRQQKERVNGGDNSCATAVTKRSLLGDGESLTIKVWFGAVASLSPHLHGDGGTWHPSGLVSAGLEQQWHLGMWPGHHLASRGPRRHGSGDLRQPARLSARPGELEAKNQPGTRVETLFTRPRCLYLVGMNHSEGHTFSNATSFDIGAAWLRW